MDNKKLIQDHAAAWQAIAEGRDVKIESRGPASDCDWAVYSNSFPGLGRWLRIKPEPKLMPWKSIDEVPLDAWARIGACGGYALPHNGS